MTGTKADPRDSKGPLTRHGEWLGLALLAGVTVFFLATSWRKWTDPLIDFGRELYLPWRLANGAVLYRDADDFYGPLSQYLNAGLFRIFGPGLMVLATANLVVFSAILASTYALFRRAWGYGAALASCAVFVSVFGFSQFFGGNHNYATPYSHEATHGFLACLLLVLALVRWLERPAAARGALAGLLFGLTVVLKPEIMLSAGLITAAAMAIGYRRSKSLPSTSVFAWALAALAPTLAFWAYFSEHFPAGEALGLASRAWLNVLGTTRFTGDIIQSTFLGFDQPWAHLVEQGMATVLAALLIAVFVAIAKVADRIERPQVRRVLGTLLAGSAAWCAWTRVDWLDIGHCVLGLTLIYLAFGFTPHAPRQIAGEDASRPALRLMIALLAAGLMTRMLLNGRIYQLGFYQAALASILVPAVLIGELPERLGLGRPGRAILVALTVIFLGTGVVRLAVRSQGLLGMKTYPVGEGVDRFLAMPPKIEATGALVDLTSRQLRRMPGIDTLVVLPEGQMINYLARLPSPVAPFFFFSAATRGFREQEIVNDLQTHPPDCIVIVSRDLREYGIARYGENPGGGKRILDWASANYHVAGSIGDDPLDYNKRGAIILRRDR
jgi:hypothetical protein